MTLRDLLIAKAGEGVKVRLLVDGIGSSRLKKAFILPLERAGAEFAFFTSLICPSSSSHSSICDLTAKSSFATAWSVLQED